MAVFLSVALHCLGMLTACWPMDSQVQVKICGLTEVDVEHALQLGADYFGFIVYAKSPRALTLERPVDCPH